MQPPLILLFLRLPSFRPSKIILLQAFEWAPPRSAMHYRVPGVRVHPASLCCLMVRRFGQPSTQALITDL